MTVEDCFFEYAKEREAIRVRRKEGASRLLPLTDDPILQTYRFTNVFREDDKVTRWIRAHDPHQRWPVIKSEWKHQVFYTIMSRWFNRFDTLVWMQKMYIIDDFFITGEKERTDRMLKDWRPKGPWVTGAYIIHTPNGHGWDKAQGVLEDVWEVWKDLDNMYIRWGDCNAYYGVTMEWMTKDLCRYRDLGPFMAYEIACDLRWSLLSADRVPKDVYTWANPGPGARRGLRRIFDREIFLANSKAGTQTSIEQMSYLLHEWTRRKAVRYREIEMREIEHTLCEFDKYERVRLGEGRPREKFKG